MHLCTTAFMSNFRKIFTQNFKITNHRLKIGERISHRDLIINREL